MVESPKYERLKAVIGLTARPLASEDYEEDERAGTARTEVGDAKGTSEDFVVDLSVGESQTKTGADSWLSSFIESAKTHQGKITTAKAHHLAVRESMSTAVTDGEQLSPVLLSESDVAASQQNPPLRLTSADGKTVEYTEPTAYLTALEQQKNDKREAEAQTILDKLNQEADSHVSEFQHQKDDYVPDAWKPRAEGDAGSAPSPSPASSGGSRGLVPTVRSGTGAGGEWTSPAPGELGSASNPISDPADLARYDLTTTPVNQRMTPNGPVGGHMPADVLNVNDPAWRAVPSAAGGGARIAGGVLVAGSAAGAAGAALSYGGGFAGIGGLASGASGSALRAVAPAGGVLRPSALPGGGVAGAVGGAGRGGGAGVVGRGGVAPVGSGGAGSAGGRGASGGVAGRGGVSAAGRGASGAGAVGRGGVAPVGSGASGTAGGRGGVAGGRGGVAGGRATSGVTAVGRGASGGVAGRGGVAPVGSGGVGDRREKKGQVRRRAYDVVRVDALEERGAQMMGGAAGSADQLKPIARDADADW